MNDGTFATARLKTYPPKLNGSFVLSLISRFSKFVAIDPDDRLVLVAEARQTILDRCHQIDVDLCSDFVEQDLDAAIPVEHPLCCVAGQGRRSGEGLCLLISTARVTAFSQVHLAYFGSALFSCLWLSS